MAFAPTIHLLMFGRFIIGLGIGMSSIAVPIYLSEISPNSKRGIIVGMNTALIPIGQFISSLIALYLKGNWRLMFGLASVPSFIQLLGMLLLPESQRWLAKKGHNAQSLDVFKRIYKKGYADKEH